MKRYYLIPCIAAVTLVLILSIQYNKRLAQRVLTCQVSTTWYQPVDSVITNAPALALTFDVTTDPIPTREILGILQEQQLQATFFVPASLLEEQPDLLMEILDQGHELGLLETSDSLFSEESLADLHNRFLEETGCQLQLFRPAYGQWDDETLRLVRPLGYQLVTWNVDSMDWKDYSVELLTAQVCENKNLSSGSLLRFHTGAKHTAQALYPILERLRKDGYFFLTVSDLLWQETI